MRVLALNAYHGGSHRAFVDEWSARSRHRFTLLTLPAYKWKWRMRHAAVTFAGDVQQLVETGRAWDVVFCTDMLNLAEFRGLCPAVVHRLPSVVYFHENQLTYPNPTQTERDLHFAFTNLTTALAADRVWFNSAFHRDDFLSALENLLDQMPDYKPCEAVSAIRFKSDVHPPGIEPFEPRGPRRDGPMRLLWAARWEHDKDPDTFFNALARLQAHGQNFRLSVLGESFDHVPNCFHEARRRFAEHIDRWGYLASRNDYRAALREADLVVSTALHEFFGIAVLEAVAAGCVPLVPNRLSYPELLGNENCFFHDGSAEDLTRQLRALDARLREGRLDPNRQQRLAERFHWHRVARTMDDALELL